MGRTKAVPESDRAKYRVWWIPQVPGRCFYVPVYTLPEAKKILVTLAEYDQFQLKNNIKGDYSNAGGLEVFKEGVWEEWSDENGNTIDDFEWEVKIRGKNERGPR